MAVTWQVGRFSRVQGDKVGSVGEWASEEKFGVQSPHHTCAHPKPPTHLQPQCTAHWGASLSFSAHQRKNYKARVQTK